MLSSFKVSYFSNAGGAFFKGAEPISLSPNLSFKPTLSPLKKKVRAYLLRPKSSPKSSARSLSLSLAGLFRLRLNLLSSEITTLIGTSTSIFTSSSVISISTSSKSPTGEEEDLD